MTRIDNAYHIFWPQFFPTIQFLGKISPWSGPAKQRAETLCDIVDKLRYSADTAGKPTGEYILSSLIYEARIDAFTLKYLIRGRYVIVLCCLHDLDGSPPPSAAMPRDCSRRRTPTVRPPPRAARGVTEPIQRIPIHRPLRKIKRPTIAVRGATVKTNRQKGSVMAFPRSSSQLIPQAVQALFDNPNMIGSGIEQSIPLYFNIAATRLKADAGLRKQMMEKSYVHGNGFERFVIYDEPGSGVRLRFHVHEPRPGLWKQNIHSHRRPFISYVCDGAVDDVPWRLCPSGELFNQLEYHSVGADGSFELKRIGQARLTKDTPRRFAAGTAYSLPVSALHFTVPAGDVPAITLFIEDCRAEGPSADTYSLPEKNEGGKVPVTLLSAERFQWALDYLTY